MGQPRTSISSDFVLSFFIQKLCLFLLLIWPPGTIEASRAYPLGCSKEDSSYYDYDKYPFPPPGVPTKTTDDYFLVERLGTGKFSDVFSAVEAEQQGQKKVAPRIDPKSLVVIKVRPLLQSIDVRFVFIEF